MNEGKPERWLLKAESSKISRKVLSLAGEFSYFVIKISIFSATDKPCARF